MTNLAATVGDARKGIEARLQAAALADGLPAPEVMAVVRDALADHDWRPARPRLAFGGVDSSGRA